MSRRDARRSPLAARSPRKPSRCAGPPRSELLSVLLSLALGCGDDTTKPPPVDVPEGECGRALYVVSSDYQSTSVAILSFEGEVLSPAFLTSGSADPGLSVALSGDVVAPTQRHDGEVLLLDRLPAGVLTFADPALGEVTAQSNVSTGFASNPQDAVRLSDGRLAVTRYGENPNPGMEPLDEGSDVLILDEANAPVDRIDLKGLVDDPELVPSPARIARTGEDRGDLVVLLAAYSKDFTKVGEGRVAIFDERTLASTGVVVLDGGFSCGGLAVAPSNARVAVACSGPFDGTSTPDPAGSALFILDRGDEGWSLTTKLGALELGGEPLAASLAFDGDGTLVAATFGRLEEGSTTKQAVADRLLTVDVDTGAFEVLLETKETPFSYGDIRCCAGVCFVADADRGVVQRLEGGALTAIPLDDGIGLPPRYLGVY